MRHALAVILLTSIACADAGPPLPDVPPVDIVPPEEIAPLPLGAPASAPTPNPAELTLQYIERLPAIDYVWHSADPTREGWPAPGQVVTWRAHVKNWFAHDVTVGYQWQRGTVVVSSGSISVAAGAVGSADYTMPWSFQRERLTFVVDPDNAVAEEDEENNRIAVYTDALSVAFYVEQGFYDFFRANQYRLAGAHSTSFEDWAQRQIYYYNEMFARAIWPETPDGVRDRLRLDRIVVVPDGSIISPNVPNSSDHSVDLQYGFLARSTTLPNYASTRVDMENQAYYSGVVQHELGHARSMIDVYGFTVYDGLPGHEVDVIVDGKRLLGSPWMPGGQIIFNGFPGIGVASTERGLMVTQWRFIDRYSAAMWNQLSGRRAVSGNFNAPDNLGWFMNALLPASTRLVLADQDGHRMPRARVALYRALRSETPSAAPYGRHFAATADLHLQADAAGELILDGNPFTEGKTTVRHDGEFSNAVLLIDVIHNHRRGFAFLPVSELNYEYLHGHRDEAVVPMRITMR